MVLGNALLNAYIDANLMIIFAFLIWVFVHFTLSKLAQCKMDKNPNQKRKYDH